MRRYHKNSNGFTMAEMLITVAIIVILCGFGFVAVIAHQRNLKRMEMDETAQEIFIAAQNHLTAARANGQWSSFLEKTAAEGQDGSRGTAMSYDPSDYNRASDADAESRKFYYFTTESAEAVKNGAEALILPEGSIDETLRGHHFYVEYDAASGTVFGVFYTDSDHPITADDATAVSLSRTDPDARRDYKVDGKRTIIGYYGGALGELNSPGDLYAPSVAVRNAESLVLYVVDKNYYRPVSSKEGAQNFQTKLKLTFEGVTSGKKAVKEVDPSSSSSQTDAFSSAVLAEKSAETFDVVIPSSGASAQQKQPVNAEYYAIVLDSIVRKDGHFADLFPEFIPGEDIRITATLTSDKAGEDVSKTVTVNSLFNSVKTEKNLSGIASKTVVTVSNPRHLENLSSEVSGVDFAAAGKQIVKDTTVDTVSVVRNLFWDEDTEAEKGEAANEKVTAFIPAIVSATGMKSEYGYNAGVARDAAAITKENLQVYPYSASGTENAASSSGNSAPTPAGEGENLITKGSCYGITNTAIKSFEGNNHILAAFRFEGKQEAALINEAADGLTVSDLLIADVSSVVTGENADGTGSNETPAAAVLLAKAKGGSIENIAVRWYEGGANQSVTLPAGRNVAAGMQGCRVYAEKGIASALIGSVDAKRAGSAAGSLEISNVSLCTMVKAASHDGKKVTAHLGIEGETTAVLLGEIKSGAVTLYNSKQSEEDRKSYVCIEGTLFLKSDKGQENAQASGGLIGRISGGENALVKQLDFTASRMEMETNGGAAGGLVGVISGGQKAGLEKISLSANSLDVTGKTAAGGAVGNVSAGELSLNKINILTIKENKQDYGEAGQETIGTEKPYGIRVTAENGTAGGLLGTASSAVTQLTIKEAAVSGSGTADQVKAGSSAGGLIGDAKASNTTITSSAASLYIRSEGNGGNVGGSNSTDGAGGLIGSASGNVTITNSYSGGRTTNAPDPDEEKSDASAKQARYLNAEEGQGRYNVYLASGSGAAGGLLGKFNGTTGSLKIENSYSTSSVAIPYSSGAAGAAAGGLVGDAGTTTLTANNTYCTGRVYANGAQNGTSVGTATGSTTGGTSVSTTETSTPNYGPYAGKLGGINGSRNYYLKGMNGIPSDAVGTLGSKTSDITIAENVLTGADYYDDNCALKQGVNTDQKSYYFDTALAAIKYPFKTVTTAIARPVCDPDTGIRNPNAEDDTNRFAQIGDWEIPKEEASAEGAYGLIYYERIWDGTTNKLDPTFYYHGYMLESGEDAKSATYKEIHSKSAFVTAKEHYVSESGYLLIVKDGVEKGKTICVSPPNKGNIEEYGQIQKEITSLSKYPLQKAAGFSGYTAYNVSLTMEDLKTDINELFTPYGQNQFGGLLTIRKKEENNTWGKSEAAFTYVPFFADALKPAEMGQIQSVTTATKEGEPQAVIRSADQMQYFFAFENALPYTGYLVQSNVSQVIEQQLDITFNHLKVTFTQNGQPATDEAYQSPTLKQIGWANATYRSKLRPNAENDKDFYVLDGLRAELVTTVYGELCDLQITDIKAPYFIQKIQSGAAKVHTITITDACFAKGENYDQATSAGFVEELSGGTIENCSIINASIYGDGFIQQISNQTATVKNCYIINATIWRNGFIGDNQGNTTITDCGIYADKSKCTGVEKNYQPYRDHNNEYNYVSIGIAPGGTKSNSNVAGFVLQQSGKLSIENCFVAGTVYGSDNYYVTGFGGEITCEADIENCYSNVVIDGGQYASGFAKKIDNDRAKVVNCHSLGVINNVGQATGFVNEIIKGSVSGCYSAFWNVQANSWYPFYSQNNSSQAIQNNYYLTDYALSVENGELVDYSTHAKGLTYQQLCDLSLKGQSAQADTTVGYYQYMNKDDDHKTYPYPMPTGMTAYGDWSHEDPDRYTLLYYEKVNGNYYFHGYSTEDGESYTELATSGDNVQHGLVAAADQKAEDDGYILIAGTNSSWSTFGRADNSEIVSSPVNNANTQVFKPVASSDTELLKALENLQGLKKKNTDKIYIFQPEQYLNYADATKNFAAWRTLTQESEGIGISVYSTKGAIPMAKFSFQPFFADTVKQPNVVSQGTSNRSEISFVTTKDEDPDYDYRIRSLRQLQALSDWDAGIWSKKENVADAQTLKKEFDQKTRRYSYLSTSSENYENHLKIRQDLDINVGGENISFARIDGTYVGKKYDNRSVMLQELRYDFAKQIASTGKICSLVIDQAKLDGMATTSEASGDIAHGGQKEFVEYNYGSISDITVQNSELGSAGLVYQNGNASKDALKKEIIEPQKGTRGAYVATLNLGNYVYKNAYGYEITIRYLKDTNAEIGSIQNCIITNSIISGAGIVWKNIGGSIADSCVQNCMSDNGIGHAGFVEYNQATVINNVPETRTEYVYLWNEYWDKENQQKVPEEIVNQNVWLKNSDSQKQISVFVNATIKNCSVSDCNIRENGFVGENSIYTQGNNSGGQAKISNCQVYGTSSYSDMKIGSSSGAADVNEVAGFVGNNGKGAEIENCSVTGQVGGRKKVAGFALTNAGTITGSYANTKITCEGNQGTMLSGFVLTNTGTIDRSHSLGEESCKQAGSGADNQAAGFVVSNQKANDSSTNAVIRNSYAAMWKLELNGTNYVPFGSIDNSSVAGSYENCYAMKLSADDGYSGTYPAASASGITYDSGEELKKKCDDGRLGNAAEAGKTTAYQAELKSTNYPFPCGSTIMNYGDWKLTDGNSATTHTITLAAGSKAVFSEDLVKSLSKNAAVMTASDDGSMGSTDEVAITGTENAYVQDTIPEEDRHEVQLELGEEEETLDLAELVPVRKGWKLLGWLITSPSELSASETTTTVSDVVTKINKLSDGEAEASGSSKAVYELETGAKSYHYAPDAVITVTEDMTLSAVWVPDDDTIEKAKDGTLRVDENGAILDGEEQVTNDVTNETTETDSDASAADTSSAVTGDDTDGMTAENQDASTDQTADASGTLPAQNTEDDMSEMSDLTGESDPEMETSTETTGEEGDPAGE